MENKKSKIEDLAKFTKDGKIIIEHRNGPAEKFLDPVAPLKKRALVIIGSIGTIAAFVAARGTGFEAINCHIRVDLDKNEMIFSGNECQSGDEHVTNVASRITESKHYLNSEINSNNDFSASDMANFLRKRKIFFTDQEQFTKVWTALSSFKASIDTQLEKVDLRDGNQRDILTQKVLHNIPKTFDLMLPIFDNVDPVKVGVEVDVEPHGLRCSLVSFDLDTIYDELKKALFDKELSIHIGGEKTELRDFCLVYNS